MNVPLSEAKEISFHDYQMLLWNWNDAHAIGDDVPSPDPERAMAHIDMINADPRLTGPQPTAS